MEEALSLKELYEIMTKYILEWVSMNDGALCTDRYHDEYMRRSYMLMYLANIEIHINNTVEAKTVKPQNEYSTFWWNYGIDHSLEHNKTCLFSK